MQEVSSLASGSEESPVSSHAFLPSNLSFRGSGLSRQTRDWSSHCAHWTYQVTGFSYSPEHSVGSIVLVYRSKLDEGATKAVTPVNLAQVRLTCLHHLIPNSGICSTGALTSMRAYRMEPITFQSKTTSGFAHDPSFLPSKELTVLFILRLIALPTSALTGLTSSRSQPSLHMIVVQKGSETNIL